MDNIIIILIILQAVFTWIGYFGLAKSIKSERKRLETLGGLIAVMPFLAYSLPLLAKGFNINGEDVSNFFTFYVYSSIANALNGLIIKIVERTFLAKKRRR